MACTRSRASPLHRDGGEHLVDRGSRFRPRRASTTDESERGASGFTGALALALIGEGETRAMAASAWQCPSDRVVVGDPP